MAIEVYVHRLRREIAAMAAAMNGLDALVFTGGIGEHNPAIRAAAAAGLGFLGIERGPEPQPGHRRCDHQRPGGARCRRWSSPRERTSRSPGRLATCWRGGADDPRA